LALEPDFDPLSVGVPGVVQGVGVGVLVGVKVGGTVTVWNTADVNAAPDAS